MTADVLKLIEKSPALTAGGYLPLDAATTIVGLDRAQLLRLVEGGELRLHCRLIGVPGHIMDRADLELDASVTGGSAWIVPSPSQMSVSAIHTVYNGVLAIPDSTHVASAIIAGALDTVDIVLFDLSSSPHQVFAPDSTVLCEVGRLELDSQQLEQVRGRLASDVTQEQLDRAREVRALTVSGLPAVKGKLFSEAVEEYCTDPSGLPHSLASHIEQRQRKAGMLNFIEFMGDMPLHEITADVLRAYRDGPLKTFPANQNNLPKELKRDTMKGCIEAIQASGRDWTCISADRQRERMSWIYRMFDWVMAKRKWIAENPAAGLGRETGLTKAQQKDANRERRNAKRDAGSEDEEGRRPFHDDELRLIFSQPHYKTGDGRHVTKGNEAWDAFEYWLPLLAAFGGCRIGEASQLHLDDVHEVDGVWVLDINDFTADKHVKTDSTSVRKIPIHPKLTELGFLDYCKRLRSEGFRRVFPELTHAKTDARYAKESGRRMSAMLASLGMPRDGMLVFHCLRHNANNGLARVPMSALPYADESLRKFIRYTVMGHELGEDVNVQSYMSTPMRERQALVAGLAYDLPEIARFDIDYGVGQVRKALERKKGERKGREDMGPLNPVVYGA